MFATILSNSFWNSPVFFTLMFILIFGAIVLGVILLKKYAKPFKNDEKPKSDKEIADEEVKRMVVDMSDEEAAAMEKASLEAEENSKKDNKDYTQEEVARATRPIEDPEAEKAMREYAEAHPEEAEAALKDEKKDSSDEGK